MVKCSLDYDPVYFLRCHSKNRDAADIQSQVWHCSFEPSTINSLETSSIVATCGGNSICFIDCSTGEVLNKYYTPLASESLFALSWTLMLKNKKCGSILAAGGSKSILYFVDRSSNQCILTHSLKLLKTVSISTLLFHPTLRNHLFCGTSNGDIFIFEFFCDDKESCNLKLHGHLEGKSEIFDFAFCTTTDMLFVSCNDGLIYYNFKSKADFCKTKKGRLLELPENPNQSLKSICKLVDSVECLDDGLIVCKCALHGKIYVFDGKELVSQTKGNSPVKVTPLSVLKWSNTDNYFMYMGVSRGANLIGCGDDRGALWLYSSSEVGRDLDPSAVLPWPQLSDRHNDKKRKLNLEVYDIVIDKVSIDSSGLYIVAVTNNNMVCIWKRV